MSSARPAQVVLACMPSSVCCCALRAQRDLPRRLPTPSLPASAWPSLPAQSLTPAQQQQSLTPAQPQQAQHAQQAPAQAQQAQPARSADQSALDRQVVLVVDGSAFMKPCWASLYRRCIYPALTHLDLWHGKHDAANERTPVRTEFALVCFCDYAPSSDSVLRTCYFTSKLPQFNEWAENISFAGGGFFNNAVCEGLHAALELLQADEQGRADKYVLLATNSSNHDAPCRLAGQAS